MARAEAGGVMHATLDDFLRHAKLFGTHCVAETARAHLSEHDLVVLRVELDAVKSHDVV